MSFEYKSFAQPNQYEDKEPDAEIEAIKRRATTKFHNDHADGDLAIYDVVREMKQLITQKQVAILSSLKPQEFENGQDDFMYYDYDEVQARITELQKGLNQ